MKTESVLGIELSPFTKDEFRAFSEKAIIGGEGIKLAKINAEMLVRAVRNKEFRDALEGFDTVIVDGRGVVWASYYLSLPATKYKLLLPLQALWQLLYSLILIPLRPKTIEKRIPEHIPGVQAFEILLSGAEKTGSGVYLFGAKDTVVSKAADNIKLSNPKVSIAGFHDGYNIDVVGKEIIKEINSSGAKLLVVALGSPKQEFWIRDNFEQLPGIGLVVGEGGTLDRVANPAHKSPQWLNQIGLEWLWRLFMNRSLTGKKSRFQRFWDSVPALILEAYKFKINIKQNQENEN